MSTFSNLIKHLKRNRSATYERVAGIDISDRTIQIAELHKKEKDSFSMSGSGLMDMEPDIVMHGRIKDAVKLQVVMRKVFNEAFDDGRMPEHIVVGLPESQTYTHTFEINKEDFDKQDERILREVESYIPLPKEETLFSHRVLYEDKERTVILIVATSKEVVEEWQLFFRSLDIVIDLFDVEHLATYRAIFNKPLTAPVCVVDMGALTSHIAIFDLHGLRYAYTVKISGEQLTKDLAEALGKTVEEAEEIKKEVGLSGADENVATILKKSLEPVFEDIKNTIRYFEEKMGTKIEEIVLVGGSSALKNIAEVTELHFEIKARVGKQSIVTSEISQRYIEALGLAYRLMDEQWERRDPAFQPFTLEEKVEEEQKKPLPPKVQKVLDILSAIKNKITSKFGSKSSTQDSDDDEEESAEDKKTATKLKRQKIILLVIVIVGLMSVPAAFWYKGKQDAAKEKEIQARLEALDALETIEIEPQEVGTTTEEEVENVE